MRTLLIDGDIVAHKVAAAVEVPIYWGDDLWTLHADASMAKEAVDAHIAGLMKTLEADAVVLCFTPPGPTFRNTIYPEYKAKRAAKRKPTILPVLREYLQEHYTSFTFPQLEGDDVLGILMTSDNILSGDKIIVSIDKDMLTVPGKIYRPDCPEQGITEVSPSAADLQHMYQTLVGDVTDGYPGCPGVGPVAARKLLADAFACPDSCTYSEMWPIVVRAYESKGLREEDAILNARMARILRAGEYDMTTHEVKLWHPRLL